MLLHEVVSRLPQDQTPSFETVQQCFRNTYQTNSLHFL